MLVITVGEVDVGNYTGGFFVCFFPASIFR